MTKGKLRASRQDSRRAAAAEARTTAREAADSAAADDGIYVAAADGTYASKKGTEIRDLCKLRGIMYSSGNKSDLIQRLEDFDSGKTVPKGRIEAQGGCGCFRGR